MILADRASIAYAELLQTMGIVGEGCRRDAVIQYSSVCGDTLKSCTIYYFTAAILTIAQAHL